MTQARIDDELYKNVSEYIKNKKIEYPTMTHFINNAIKEKLASKIKEKEENEETIQQTEKIENNR